MKSFITLIACAAAITAGAEYRLRGTLDRENPVYKPGEKMVFKLKLTKDGLPVEGYTLKWERTGDDGVSLSGQTSVPELDCRSGEPLDHCRIIASTDKPGFVRIYATVWKDGEQIRQPMGWRKTIAPLVFDGGACVAPEKLEGLPEPTDFDRYWKEQKRLLAATPMEVLEKKEVEGNSNVVVYDVKIACAGSMPVSGYLVMPRDAKPGSLIAEVGFKGYGVKSANKNLKAGEDKIYLEINAHGIGNGMPPEFYENLRNTTYRGYGFDEKENANPETSFFHGMYLRVMRSLEFVKSLPEWNRSELHATGGSQGGMQSLAAAGLDPDVTFCYAWSPWNCDFGRTETGRLVGDWHVKYSPALNYFDPINHVKRANPKCRLEIVANLGDYVCPPSGVWIAYNNFPGPKKMLVRQGCEHGYNMPDYPEFVIEE